MNSYHKTGSELNPKHRYMYFQLGAEITNARTVRQGFRNDEYGHELALMALEATSWKSLKAARAMSAIMGYYL